MKITKIWFDGDYIYGADEQGRSYRQSLLWYKALRAASDREREQYHIGYDGIHWRNLDEDISFESFLYDDAEPTPLQRFFLIPPEFSIATFANTVGVSPTLLQAYVNGTKKPSTEDETYLLQHLPDHAPMLA